MKTDKAWKNAIEGLFEDFVAFFMPDLYEIADFSKPNNYEFLDNEFNKLFPETEVKNRRVDKLAKILLKDGTEKWVLLHAEVQGYSDEEFETRMFEYFYRIFESYKRKIYSLAIFTYKGDSNKSSNFEMRFLKSRLLYEYDTYDVSKQDPEQLKNNKNPFALVVLAALEAINHKDNDDNNYEYRKRFLKLLLSTDFEGKTAREIFRFVSFIFSIDDPLKRKLFYKEAHEMALKEEKLYELTDYEEVAVEENTKKVKSEMAKKMKNKCIDIQTISDVTGMSKHDIEKL